MLRYIVIQLGKIGQVLEQLFIIITRLRVDQSRVFRLLLDLRVLPS